MVYRITKSAIAFSLAFTVIMAASARAQAAVITWGSAQDVNGADLSQLSTNGTLVGAVKAGTSDQTLGSITFYRFDSFTRPGDVTTFATFILTPNITLTAADADASYLNGSDFGIGVYGGLMSSTTTDISSDANPVGVGGTRNLDITGLTPGNQYEVQVWTPTFGVTLPHDPRPQTTTTFAGFLPVTLNVGLRGVAIPQAPQFAIGTFIADGTGTQTVSFANMYWAAMQMRDITPAPEPSSIGLATLGFIGLFGMRRRQQG